MKSFDEVLRGASRAAIVGHVSPDGDCVGSCLGLYEYIRVNYPVQIDVFLDPFSDSLQFLTGTKVINPEVGSDVTYDILFALDCADRERIGAGKELLGRADRLICIDHHISNPGYGDINVIVPDASSACEVVYSLMDESKITAETAVCLYTGIVHDTGVFQYSNVSPLTMSRVSHLMSFGFDFSSIIMSSFYEKPFSHQKLMGQALKKSRITSDGNGVWSFVTLEEMKEAESSVMETEGIVEQLRNTKGIDYSVFLYEKEPGVYKVSFRSKGKTDVSRAAAAFGGGGHTRASGCSFSGKTPDEIMEAITKEIAGQNHD